MCLDHAKEDEITEDIDKPDVRLIMAKLHAAFIWGSTPQGAEYWIDVIENLERLL